MKKLILFLSFFGMIACSSSDEDNLGLMYASNIKVGGEPFIPTKYTETDPWSIFTRFEAGIEGTDTNRRTFRFLSYHDDQQFIDEIYVSVAFPSSQEKADGTYVFNADNQNASAYYRIGTAYFSFVSGTVSVTELGNNNFKLKFTTIMARDSYDGAEKTVTGYFKGTFFPID
jgi:hypothetical protein